VNNDIEPIMAALLTHLAGAVVVDFTASATSGSVMLTDVSVFDGLFVGLPVFGPAVSRSTTIAAFDADAGTITLSDAVTADGTAEDFTTGFLTVSRRVQFWSQVTEQPALFIRHDGDDDSHPNIIFGKTEVSVELWIYSKAGEDPNTAPDIALNQLVKAIRNSLLPDAPTGKFTLGGLVDWCRIEGHSSFDPGDIDGQSKALLPVKLLLP
jgi:hypothetical protein